MYYSIFIPGKTLIKITVIQCCPVINGIVPVKNDDDLWSAVAQLVECRTRNRESLGFESPLLPFRSLGIFFHFTTPQSTQLYK